MRSKISNPITLLVWGHGPLEGNHVFRDKLKVCHAASGPGEGLGEARAKAQKLEQLDAEVRRGGGGQERRGRNKQSKNKKQTKQKQTKQTTNKQILKKHKNI